MSESKKVRKPTSELYSRFIDFDSTPEELWEDFFHNRGWTILVPFALLWTGYTLQKYFTEEAALYLLLMPVPFAILFAVGWGVIKWMDADRSAKNQLIEIAQKPEYWRKKAATDEGYSEEEAQMISEDLENYYRDKTIKNGSVVYMISGMFLSFIYPLILMLYALVNLIGPVLWPLNVLGVPDNSILELILVLLFFLLGVKMGGSFWFGNEELTTVTKDNEDE